MSKFLSLTYLKKGLCVLWDRYIRVPYEFKRRYKNVDILQPLAINPQFVIIDNNTRLQPDVKIISAGHKVIIKKFTAISAGCLIIPGAHIPTVGIPQYLSKLHINERGDGIIINEDCWIGAESALLSECEIGRGCVVGTRSVVTKKIPPYAVVAGVPAKIIATRFTLDEIIEHERILYPASERFDISFLKELFDTTYKGLKSIGTSKLTEEDLLKLNKAKSDEGIKIYN